MKDEEKQEFSSKYYDELLVEVLENGKQLAQNMAEVSCNWKEETEKLDSISRFADIILKAKEYAQTPSVAVSRKFR